MNKNKQDLDSVSPENVDNTSVVEACVDKKTIDMRKSATIVFGMFLMAILSFFMNMAPNSYGVGFLLGAYVLLRLYNQGVLSKGE